MAARYYEVVRRQLLPCIEQPTNLGQSSKHRAQGYLCRDIYRCSLSYIPSVRSPESGDRVEAFHLMLVYGSVRRHAGEAQNRVTASPWRQKPFSPGPALGRPPRRLLSRGPLETAPTPAGTYLHPDRRGRKPLQRRGGHL